LGKKADVAAEKEGFPPLIRHDFLKVCIHVGHEAAAYAKALNARANTIGDDIVFGEGEYAPHTAVSRRLMAAELAHIARKTIQPPRYMAHE
jgi:hypothetical protein